MLGLLVSTVLTSAADSVNPIAITQQFVLQGMVKKPKHIWYFILPTGITNLIGGFLAYFGLVAFIGDFFRNIMIQFGEIVLAIELIIGIVFLIGVKIQILKKRRQTPTYNNTNRNDEASSITRIKSVTPPALVALGIGATISELTTALPYYAFLAILFNYNLSFIHAALILIVYNFIYTLPLMVLYFVYKKARRKFDRFYDMIKIQMTKWSNILAPAVTAIIGIFLVFHSISVFLF